MNQTIDYTSPPPKARLDWVDTARGLAIILVVFGHCWRGLDQAGIISNQFLIRHVDDFIYMFHMNAFFVLAGCFLMRHVQKASASGFVWRQIARLLYPLVLWTYIFIGLRILAGDGTNSQSGPSDLWTSPLPPLEHMWFLWALFIGMILLGLLMKLFPALTTHKRAWYAIASAGLVFWAVVDIPLPLIPWLGETMRHTPFLAFGVALGLSTKWMSGRYPLPMVSLIVFLTLGIAAGYFPVKSLSQGTASAVMTVVFLQMAQWLSHRWSGKTFGNILQQLGQMTMAIFLAHTIFSAATRIVFLKLGVNDPIIHLTLGTATGVIGPTVMYHLAQRLNLSRVLGF